MMTSGVYYFCMLTVKFLLWLMNYSRTGHPHVLRAACSVNLKGLVGLILAKSSVMRISVPLDLSSRSFIPLPCFIRSRRPTQLLRKRLSPLLIFFPPGSA
jgi:hypothetical protein